MGEYSKPTLDSLIAGSSDYKVTFKTTTKVVSTYLWKPVAGIGQLRNVRTRAQLRARAGTWHGLPYSMPPQNCQLYVEGVFLYSIGYESDFRCYPWTQEHTQEPVGDHIELFQTRAGYDAPAQHQGTGVQMPSYEYLPEQSPAAAANDLYIGKPVTLTGLTMAADIDKSGFIVKFDSKSNRY